MDQSREALQVVDLEKDEAKPVKFVDIVHEAFLDVRLVIQRFLVAFIVTVLNSQVLVIGFFAFLSTYLCEHVFSQNPSDGSIPGVRYKFDTTFVSTAIVFPLIFSIQAAFSRRESAARAMSLLKTWCMVLYTMHRDGHRNAPGDLSTVGKNDEPLAVEARAVLTNLLRTVQKYLTEDRDYESNAERIFQSAAFKDSWLSLVFKGKIKMKGESSLKDNILLMQCYDCINRVSMLVNKSNAVAWKNINACGGASYPLTIALTTITASFEDLRLMRGYRTPVMLRYGNRVLIFICAIMLGPYFNTYCFDNTLAARLLGSNKQCSVNYIVASIFTVTVTLLSQIARDIEYPFDMEGMDDLIFELAAEIEDYAQLQNPPHQEVLSTPMDGNKPSTLTKRTPANAK